MATWTLNFHTAGLFNVLRGRRDAMRGAAEPALALAGAVMAPAADLRVSRRRAEAMRGFFPKLSAWMAKHGHLAEMSEVDRYLSQATDLYDLERRIRDIERRGNSPRWFR
jgi:hypothetical protein